MFCLKCGKKLTDEEKTCPNCGTSMDKIEKKITYKSQQEDNYEWEHTNGGKTSETSRAILRTYENAQFSLNMGILSLALCIIFGIGAVFGILAILRTAKTMKRLPDIVVNSKTEVKFLDIAKKKAGKGKLFGMISCVVGAVALVLEIVLLIVLI